MTNTREHYDRLLGPIYAWMIGDFENASASAAETLASAGVLPIESGQAVDLGCGHGVQSIPLADGGYDVLAIDTCDDLLAYLSEFGRTGIRTVNDDLLNFRTHLVGDAHAIICMGDTLTHLESEEAALSLIDEAATALVEGGNLCLSFRDYTGPPLESENRFIPVKLGDNRLHTCVLEDAGDQVCVTDLVHSRSEEGWRLAASSYLKAKVSPEAVKRTAAASGLTLTVESSKRGMHFFGFRRTAG